MRDRYKGTSSFILESSHRISQLTNDPNFAYFNTTLYTLMSLCKDEKLAILKDLLCIEDSLISCKYILWPMDELRTGTSVLYNDKERYLKMAMRFDSKDPAILSRKKIEIICK